MIAWEAVRDKGGVKKWKVESGKLKNEKWGEGQISEVRSQRSKGEK
jgi:hypothetical protein